MTRITFTTVDGAEHPVDAEDGESLMQLALRNRVPGIIGECGGEMSCGTCHVFVGEPWASQLPPASADERDLLEMTDECRAESRLGCQVRACAELDGLRVDVAEA